MDDGKTGRRDRRQLGLAGAAVLTVAALVMLCVVAFRHPPEPPESGQGVRVFVGIPPMADFVRRIAGPRGDAKVLVGPGRSAHTFEPTPRQMAELSEADVYFTIGLPFERKIARKLSASLARLRVMDASKGVTFLASSERDHGAAEAHAAHDPHIWLDPIRVKIVAGNIADALSEIDPAGKADYEKRLADFRRDLDDLHARVSQILMPVRGKEFLVFHPSFAYFAKRYDLVEVPAEVMGKEPSAKELAGIVDETRRMQTRVIFVQVQFAQASARAIARETGMRLVDLDPLGDDYIRDIEEIARKVADGLADVSSPARQGRDSD